MVLIERGTMRDYELLKGFHYLGGRPGVVERVYRAVAPGTGTEAQRHGGTGMVGEAHPTGVLVVCYPMLHCRGRDLVTGGRYRGMSARESARLINKEVRLISRVIVLPQWRGSGVATALVRHALNNASTVYTEALAAMGRACPFFERAGMEKVVMPARVEQVRLRGVLEEVGLGRRVLVSSRRSREVVNECSAGELMFLQKELRVWWRSVGRVTKGEAAGLGWEGLLGEARRRVWVEPWYFWGEARRHGGTKARRVRVRRLKEECYGSEGT